VIEIIALGTHNSGPHGWSMQPFEDDDGERIGGPQNETECRNHGLAKAKETRIVNIGRRDKAD
jgi:hypothetical protein